MSLIKELTLYSYFHSSAGWRVRSVMGMKKIPFKYEAIHLVEGKQHSEEFLKVSPMHQVPAFKVETHDGKVHMITQSLAMIQFLEELYPNNPVLPSDPILRAKCRAIADTISAGIQPLQNHETLTQYTDPLGQPPLSPEERQKLAQFWINKKLLNLEKLIKPLAGKYCIGDTVTLADVCLVPQMFNARRFGLDTNNYPVLKAIDERLQELQIFKDSHPFECPDAPKN